MVRTATYFTLSQAAKETGKSKSVISKALKDGTISHIEKDDSGYKIDPAELFRVFSKNPVLERERERSRTPERTGKNAPENGSNISTLEMENKLLHLRIQDKEERIGELTAQREDLQKERDKWHETANKLLLTYSPAIKTPEKPIENENEVQEDDMASIEKGAKNANMSLYGIFGVGLLLLTVLMNYFQMEIKGFIDQNILGKSAPAIITENPPEPAENVEEGRGERGKEPLQSFPPVLLNRP